LGCGGLHAISLHPFFILFTIDSEIIFFKIQTAKKIPVCHYQTSENEITKLDMLVASIYPKKNRKTSYLKKR